MENRATHNVTIDDVETTLTFDSFSQGRGYQYLTPGNASSHAFNWPLTQQLGRKFLTNGHVYQVLD